MEPDLIDIYDRKVREEHPHTPYYNGDHWAVPYVINSHDVHLAGVGEALFHTLREAIVEALLNNEIRSKRKP